MTQHQTKRRYRHLDLESYELNNFQHLIDEVAKFAEKYDQEFEGIDMNFWDDGITLNCMSAETEQDLKDDELHKKQTKKYRRAQYETLKKEFG